MNATPRYRPSPGAEPDASAPEAFFVHIGRATAGALIFALPMLMTMEMWRLGFYADRGRLALLLVVTVPLLVGLSHLIGFEETFDWREDLRDAFIAIAVGALTSALALWLFGVLTADMPADEIVGKIAIQTVPASIGALLARSQLGGGDDTRRDRRERGTSYAGTLLLVAIGALFLSLNVAPTEEMVLIAYKMTPWQELAMIAASLAIMHAFVYAVNFRGAAVRPREATFRGLFYRFTLSGYAVVLLVSLYVLWTFGRLDGVSLAEMLSASVVLAFPGAVGAAGARLIL